MHLLWASFAEMSLKELILCFSHTHQLGNFKGLQHGKRKESHDELLLSIAKPQQSTKDAIKVAQKSLSCLLHSTTSVLGYDALGEIHRY